MGLVSISGGQKPAIRIDANPTALSSVGLSLEDLKARGVGRQRKIKPRAALTAAGKVYTIGANDQLLTSDQYRKLVVAYKTNAPIYLSDVATVDDGVENVRQAAWMNETPAVIVNIQRQPGANIIDVVERVKKLLTQLKASLPAAINVDVLTDRTITIRASVEDVQFELVLTIGLVVLVIFVFLRNFAGHDHSQRGGAAEPGRHVRRHVSAGTIALII